jgi:hypothetical protein
MPQSAKRTTATKIPKGSQRHGRQCDFNQQRGQDGVVQPQRLKQTERKKQQQEGHCFLCRRQGHMCRACPKKKDEGGKRGSESNHAERVRMVTTEQENEINQQGRNEQGGSNAPESLPVYDPESLISHIKTLSINQHDELLDKLMEGDSGF